MSSDEAGVSIRVECETSSQNLFTDEVQERKIADIKRLEGRLRVLEEEADTLKGAFLESVQERKKLITEIYEHFEIIQHNLMQRELRRGEICTHGSQIISFLKNRRAGLLQVLWQESNPWLLKRDLRANNAFPFTSFRDG